MRQCKRFEIADRLAGELQIIPESRMLTIVGQAMKHKRYIGELPMAICQNVVKFNLFADKVFQKKKNPSTIEPSELRSRIESKFIISSNSIFKYRVPEY